MEESLMLLNLSSKWLRQHKQEGAMKIINWPHFVTQNFAFVSQSYSESRNATIVGDGLTLQCKSVQKICLMIELWVILRDWY